MPGENEQGSEVQDGAAQPTATDSPAVEEKAGEPAKPAEATQQPAKNIPPPSFFVEKRKKERAEKEVAQTIQELKEEVARLKSERESYTQEPEPSQPAPKGQTEDQLRQIIRDEQAALLREQTAMSRQAEANQWLASQKHVNDPKFEEGVRKYIGHLQQQEEVMGFKSDPLYLAKKAYDDVADYFGVSGSAALDDGAGAAPSNASAPAPTGGIKAGGFSGNEKVSASEVTAKLTEAIRNKDGETYNKLIAQRDQALKEGRLIP